MQLDMPIFVCFPFKWKDGEDGNGNTNLNGNREGHKEGG